MNGSFVFTNYKYQESCLTDPKSSRIRSKNKGRSASGITASFQFRIHLIKNDLLLEDQCLKRKKYLYNFKARQFFEKYDLRRLSVVKKLVLFRFSSMCINCSTKSTMTGVLELAPSIRGYCYIAFLPRARFLTSLPRDEYKEQFIRRRLTLLYNSQECSSKIPNFIL